MPSLTKYDEAFLKKSWDWLNDPEIRSLTLTPEFSKEAQSAFFKSIPNRIDYWIKGIAEDGMPIGAMGLKKIDFSARTAEYWGYIGEREYWGRGIGKFILGEAIQHAKTLKLNSIYLIVAKNNVRAKALYKKLGFELESEVDGVEKYILEL